MLISKSCGVTVLVEMKGGEGGIGAGGGISKEFVMRKVKSMYAGTPRNTFPLTTIRYHPDAIQ